MSSECFTPRPTCSGSASSRTSPTPDLGRLWLVHRKSASWRGLELAVTARSGRLPSAASKQRLQPAATWHPRALSTTTALIYFVVAPSSEALEGSLGWSAGSAKSSLEGCGHAHQTRRRIDGRCDIRPQHSPCRRFREIPNTAPSPASIMAQVSGSGTAAGTATRFAAPFCAPR